MQLQFSSSLAIVCGFIAFVSATRTLEPHLNAGCPLQSCSTFGRTPPFTNNLVYVISNDPKNADAPDYRMYWSAIGAPTFLVVQVPKGTGREDYGITWMEYLLSGHPPKSPFLDLPAGRYVAMTLMNIMEFDDEARTGRIENATTVVAHALSDATWYDVALTSSDSNLNAVFTGVIPGAFGNKNITIEVKAFVADTRDSDAPHLLVQPNSANVRIILDHAAVRWDRSRFALEIIYTSNDSSNQTATHDVVHSGTDKFSPGVYTVERTFGTDTYMEWRPVAYTKANSSVASFTGSATGDFSNIAIDFNHTVPEGGVPFSLLLGLAGAAHLTHFNVSLGKAGDGYYNSTKYLDWSCQIGIGQPQLDPADPVNPPAPESSKIGIDIGIGCGLGAAVLISAIVGFFVYKRSQRRQKESTLLISKTTTTYETLGQD